MSDFIEAAKDFFREKKIIAIIVLILIFFAICALVIALIQNVPEKKVKTVSVPNDFSSDSALLVPNGPKILDDYYPTRVTKEKWDFDEAGVFLTLPDGNALKNLEKSNDKIANDILEAAP